MSTINRDFVAIELSIFTLISPISNRQLILFLRKVRTKMFIRDTRLTEGQKMLKKRIAGNSEFDQV